MARYLIRFSKPGIFRIGSVRFLGGVNEISSEQWDEIKTHPLLPIRFDIGDLEFVPGKGPEDFMLDKVKGEELPAKGKEVLDEETGVISVENPLLACGANKAKRLVHDTYDLSVLKNWLEQETRPSVIETLKAQIEKIEPVPPKEGEDDGDNKKANKPVYA